MGERRWEGSVGGVIVGGWGRCVVAHGGGAEGVRGVGVGGGGGGGGRVGARSAGGMQWMG